jgi:hypothetical protein
MFLQRFAAWGCVELRVLAAAGEEDEEETATPAPYHLVLQAYMQQQGAAAAQQQAPQPAASVRATPGASGAATPARPASPGGCAVSPLRTPAEELIVYQPQQQPQQQQQQQQQAVEWSFMPISPYADHELALSPVPTPPAASAAARQREPSPADLQRGSQQQLQPAAGGLRQAAACPAASPTLSELGFRSAPISSSTSPVPFGLDDAQQQQQPQAASGGTGSVSRSLSLTTLPSEAVAAQRVPYSDWQAAQAADDEAAQAADDEPALADTAGSGGAASQQLASSSGRFSLSTLPSEAARAQRVAYSEWQQQQLRGAATPAALADTAASRAVQGQAAQGQAAHSGGSVLDLSPLAPAPSAATLDLRSLSVVGSEVAAANRVGFEEWQQQVRGGAGAAGGCAAPARRALHRGVRPPLNAPGRPWWCAAGPRRQPAHAHAGGRYQQERQQPSVRGHTGHLQRGGGGWQGGRAGSGWLPRGGSLPAQASRCGVAR